MSFIGRILGGVEQQTGIEGNQGSSSSPKTSSENKGIFDEEFSKLHTIGGLEDRGIDVNYAYNKIGSNIDMLKSIGKNDPNYDSAQRMLKLYDKISKSGEVSFSGSNVERGIERSSGEVKNLDESTSSIRGSYTDKKGNLQAFEGKTILTGETEQDKTKAFNKISTAATQVLSDEQLDSATIKQDSKNGSYFVEYDAGNGQKGYLKVFEGDDGKIYTLQREQDGKGGVTNGTITRLDKKEFNKTSDSKKIEKSMSNIEKKGLDNNGNINDKGLKELTKIYNEYNAKGIPIPPNIQEKINDYTKNMSSDEIKEFNNGLEHDENGGENLNFLLAAE